MNRSFLCVSCAIACLTSGLVAQVGPTMEVAAPVHPSPVPGDGQVHLVYELHLTNWTRADQVLRRLQVVNPGTGVALLSLEGEDLLANTVIVGAERRGDQGEEESLSLGVEIPPGRRALVYLWASVAPEDTPGSLSHRILYEQVGADGGSEVVELDTDEIGMGPPPVVISPPLRGDNWLTTSFGRQKRTGHSRLVFTTGGHATIAQRFAVDLGRFVGGPEILVSQSFLFPGVEGNEGSRSWGEEVLAVADGVVRAVTEGIPDNEGPERAVDISLQTAGGNSVLLDIGDDRYAYYAHLQQGSIRVSAGQTVEAGQVLGVIGNSGNTGSPHLHFHMTLGGGEPWGGEGIPFVIDRFDLVGMPTGIPGTFLEWFAPRPREREMVLPNHLVNFPGR